MGDHHDGRAQAFLELEDEVIEPPRADRVQSGGGLIKKENIRIKRHGPGQPRPLAHAAAYFRGVKLLESGQPHQRELEEHQLPDLRGRQVGVFAERDGDVFRQGHGAPEGAALVEHAEVPHHALPLFLLHFPEAGFAIEHPAAGGLFQPDEVPHQGALAAAASPHDDEHLATPDGEVEIAHDHKVAVCHGEIMDGNVGELLSHCI